MNGDEINQAARDIFGDVHNRIAKLADLINYSRSMLCNYRNGNNVMPPELARKITKHQLEALEKRGHELSKERETIMARQAEVANRFRA